MANEVTLRKEVSKLMPDELAALRDGYQQMQALSQADNRSWIYWSGQHGFPGYNCWHHSRVGFGKGKPYDLFLPWHRAYLLYFEHTVRDRNAAASIPWWDWSTDESHQIGVPVAFSDTSVNPNPLLSGPVPPIQNQPARQTLRFPGDPSELPTVADVNAVLALTDFIDFTSQVQDLHDNIHGWTGGTDPNDPNNGGDMGNIGTSAFDPIFWSHHVQIDRLWYLWQLKNGNDSIPQDYLGLPLSPFALTVKDVLDVQQLGYSYGVASVGVSA